MNTVVGDLDGNAAAMVEWSRAAAASGADLAVFPEQSLAGYPAEDLLLKRHFLERCASTLDLLAPQLAVPSLVGFPELADDLYNSAAVIVDGAVAGVYRKQHLPNYAVFDEHRYFREGDTPSLLRVGDVTVGITICEDIWVATGPANVEAAAGAQVIVNLSASPFRTGRGDTRQRMLATRAADMLAVVVLCNQVGGQDELVFDGHSLAVDHEGVVLARGAQFAEQLVIVDIDLDGVVAARLHDTRHRAVDADGRLPVLATIPAAASGASEAAPPQLHERLAVKGVAARPIEVFTNSALPVLDELAEVWAALCLGLRDYIAKNGFDKVVLGLSGGIDSAMVLTLAVDTLGADGVLAVTMPSRYTSDGTRSDAHVIARRQGVELLELPIEPVVTSYDEVLAAPFAARDRGLAHENLQARIRGNLLMALSNELGHLVLTTGNKSEVSVGYMTLYGDMAGGFAPLKDVPKTLVYRLAAWRNEQAVADGQAPVIPPTTIERPPTAELRADQRDSDSLPPYELLDPLLEALVEDDRGRDELVADGFDAALVDRVATLVDRAEYKRRQAPPGIRITGKAFGRDRRMPITNRFRD
jgi:NAD+ synthase (glutamine-hydrolysing)